MPLHEQTYPFYEVKGMSMVTPVALDSLFKRMLDAGKLPAVPLMALQNKSASSFLDKVNES
jgi:hypothetical protein